MTERTQPQAPEVRAAGGVVMRPGPDGHLQVLVVHRPAYDDWSLPKGKLDPGEAWHHAAVREVHEETGVTAQLGVELTPTHYTDRHGRPKRVRWWTMPVLAQEPRDPDDEVDERRWVDVEAVGALLTYDADRALVAEAMQASDHATVLVVRHTHAGDRPGWNGNDRLRPLSEFGHGQASALVPHLAPWRVARIVTSPLVRCVQTIEPMATALDLPVETDERLAEGASSWQVQSLLRECMPGTVLCSHGDVIGTLVRDLSDRGIVDPDRMEWDKGSTWALRLDGGRDAVGGTYLPPPA